MVSVSKKNKCTDLFSLSKGRVSGISQHSGTVYKKSTDMLHKEKKVKSNLQAIALDVYKTAL